MRKSIVVVAVILALSGQRDASAQGTNPAERKAFREYTSPQELVSIAPSTTLDKALSAISEVSQKFVGKIIIDTDRRTMPINVDIQGMQWRDALEAICRKNDIWYTEYENYIQVTPQPGAEGGTAGQPGKAGAPGGTGPAGSTDIQKEYATFKSREIRITAVFIEVNLHRLEELGINWNFIKTPTADINQLDASSQFADNVSNKIFKVDFTPHLNTGSLDILIRTFSSYDLGEVLSTPQIIVRSGEEGRIQVGQDFSIKERDFAGNLIDKFYSAGTIIRVKPQVITEQGVNFIHMTAEAERSTVQPGALSTIVNRTKANTNVLLLDGEETIVGGLYNTEETTTRSGIPFLKDLPWWVFGLRYVFGYNKEEVTKKELVILIKAELVPTLQERITQKTKEEGIFERWLQEKTKDERRIMGGKE